MHGPWHCPVHPDEKDNSAHERETEEAELMARLEAHALPLAMANPSDGALERQDGQLRDEPNV